MPCLNAVNAVRNIVGLVCASFYFVACLVGGKMPGDIRF